jgi:hypothetical protein
MMVEDGFGFDPERMSAQTFWKMHDFIAKHPDVTWGPGHIVFEDDNILDCHLQWCIELAKAALSHDPKDLSDPDDIELMENVCWYEDCRVGDLRATIQFLEELLKIPEEDR